MIDYSEVTFIAPAAMPNKVTCIKAIRTLTGLGLREAKDASERVGVEQTFETPHWSIPELEEQMRILRSEGFEIGPPVQKLLDELRQLGAKALTQGEDELANEILQLVLAEKLRRGILKY